VAYQIYILGLSLLRNAPGPRASRGAAAPRRDESPPPLESKRKGRSHPSRDEEFLPSKSQRAKSSIHATSTRRSSRKRTTTRRLVMVDYERDVIGAGLQLSALTGGRRVRLSPLEILASRVASRAAYSGVIPVDESEPRPYSRKGEIILPSQQCIAEKKYGGQCGLRTCSGVYCWLHLKATSGLRIKKSAIPGAGRGLFTTRPFATNEEITRYIGDLAATPNSIEMTKDSEYLVQVTQNRLIDGARTNSMPSRFINAPAASRRHTNATWKIRRGANEIRITATEPIPANTEILIGYGHAYWNRARGRGCATACA
jgi:hypothetical protein